jgi:hypothetical protein
MAEEPTTTKIIVLDEEDALESAALDAWACASGFTDWNHFTLTTALGGAAIRVRVEPHKVRDRRTEDMADNLRAAGMPVPPIPIEWRTGYRVTVETLP